MMSGSPHSDETFRKMNCTALSGGGRIDFSVSWSNSFVFNPRRVEASTALMDPGLIPVTW
jgi:hypothetical protein